MEDEWGPAKATANLKEHGVAFADSVGALEDELALTIEDPGARDEARFISLGMDAYGRLLVTVFTYRDAAVPVISSRKATRLERKRYEGIG